jgi:hypothetical protein
MRILGVDVGVIHFALCLCEVLPDQSPKVIRAALINLTNPLLGHESCSLRECQLSHSKMNCDRVDHMLQCLRHDYFDVADEIVMEQQPLGGIKDIEQLLVKEFRSRIRLISPIRIHRWLGIRGKSYEERKVLQEAAAVRLGFACVFDDSTCCDRPCLIHRTGLTQYYVAYEDQRTHDMADAFLMVCYSLTHPICHTEWFEEKTEDLESGPPSLLTPSMVAFFESFRYHPRPHSYRWDTFRLSSLTQ